MDKSIRVISGKVKYNPYGNWDDVDKGIFLDGHNINTIFAPYIDKNIKITIEPIINETRGE